MGTGVTTPKATGVVSTSNLSGAIGPGPIGAGPTTRRQPQVTPSTALANIRRRIPDVLVTAGLLAIAFAQAAGRIVVDTKFDLTVDPGRFLAAATRLWDPLAYFGSVQNQAYGYLIPMGPFYWLGHVLGVPAWITQRAWLGLLFAIAYWGTILVAQELGIGGRWTQMCGGIAYALSPIMLTAALASAGLLPVVLLPWVMLPLLRASHGKTSLSGAAARSGVAILLMGGVNATSVFAVLPLPVIWFLTRRAGPQRNRLFVYWVGATVLATAWFLVALVFQGKYGFNFIPYTETATATTKLASVPETLRGAGVWLSLVTINGQWTPAGYLFETLPATIVGTASVAAAGIYGLTRRDMPERLFLVLSLGLASLAICAGYWGDLGGPLSGFVRYLLTGPLAPLRNVYKFQPVVTFPLVLGLIHALHVWGRAMARALGALRMLVMVGFVALVVTALALASFPALDGNLYPAGSYAALPSYWTQASHWLNARGALSTTVVLPGAPFGRFDWGTTNDQPIEALSNVPWGDRNIAPLGSIGNTQFLDALDRVLANGQPVPGLAEYLASAGVRYLLVENDINSSETGSPPAVTIRTALAGDPGISRVAQFGPVVVNDDSGPFAEVDFAPLSETSGLRALEIYQVATTGSGNSMVTTYPASTGVVLSGGPQGVLPLAASGQLANQAVALAGDVLAPKFTDPTWVDTDSQQLRDTTFGQLYDNVSYVLQPNEAAPTVGGNPKEWTVVPGNRHETVSVLHGAASVTASSYGTPVDRIPGYQPLDAFINNPETASWVASGTNLQDPWIQITFHHPVPISRIEITPLHDGPWRPIVEQVVVSTSQGKRASSLTPDEVAQSVPVASGDTTFLRVTIARLAKALEPAADAGPGFIHISIPGVTVSQSWKLPADGATGAGTIPSYLFTSPLPNQFAYLSAPDEEPHMSRIFSVPFKATFHVDATITPLPIPQIVKEANTTGSLVVRASSTFGNLPLYKSGNLIDSSTLTSWWAGAGDSNPRLTYTWPRTLTLSSLDFAPDLAASRPEVLRLTTPTKSELVQLPATAGTVQFAPLTTNRLTVTFPTEQRLTGYNILTNGDTVIPIGMAELSFPAVTAVYPPVAHPLSRPFTLTCGHGPTIDVDGRNYSTEVTGTYAQLNGLEPMSVTLCTPHSDLTLGPGLHTLTVHDSKLAMKVTSLSLSGTPLPAGAAPRSVSIVHWGATQRTIRVTPGSRAIIGVHQNYNVGWVARAGGIQLKPVRLDGWQQGYILPASTSPQTVTLTFAPENPFRYALLAGAALAFLLVVWACIPNRRRRPRIRSDARSELRPKAKHRPPVHAASSNQVHLRDSGESVPHPAEGSGPRGASEARGSEQGRARGQAPISSVLMSRHGYTSRPVVSTLVLTAAMFLLIGPAAVIVPLLVVVPRIDRPSRQRFKVVGTDLSLVISATRRAISLPWLAFAATVAAGVVIAIRPGLTSNAFFGPLSFTAQILGGVALGALVVSLIPGLARWESSGGDSGPPAWHPPPLPLAPPPGAPPPHPSPSLSTSPGPPAAPGVSATGRHT